MTMEALVFLLALLLHGKWRDIKEIRGIVLVLDTYVLAISSYLAERARTNGRSPLLSTGCARGGWYVLLASNGQHTHKRVGTQK